VHLLQNDLLFIIIIYIHPVKLYIIVTNKNKTWYKESVRTRSHWLSWNLSIGELYESFGLGCKVFGISLIYLISKQYPQHEYGNMGGTAPLI